MVDPVCSAIAADLAGKLSHLGIGIYFFVPVWLVEYDAGIVGRKRIAVPACCRAAIVSAGEEDRLVPSGVRRIPCIYQILGGHIPSPAKVPVDACTTLPDVLRSPPLRSDPGRLVGSDIVDQFPDRFGAAFTGAVHTVFPDIYKARIEMILTGIDHRVAKTDDLRPIAAP